MEKGNQLIILFFKMATEFYKGYLISSSKQITLYYQTAQRNSQIILKRQNFYIKDRLHSSKANE